MKNYKIVIISLLLVVVCTLCSCGNSSTDKSDKNKDTKAKATQQVANKTDDEDRMYLFKKIRTMKSINTDIMSILLSMFSLFMITNTEELIAKMYMHVNLK